MYLIYEVGGDAVLEVTCYSDRFWFF